MDERVGEPEKGELIEHIQLLKPIYQNQTTILKPRSHNRFFLLKISFNGLISGFLDFVR